jgi:hypothetical protein
MSEARSQLAMSALGISEVTRLIRARIPALATHIAARIQSAVPAYAGPTTGRRHGLIELAVKGALTEFVEALENPATHGRGAEELLRRMGHGEATEGHTLDAMHAAVRVATEETWEELHRLAVERDLPSAVLGSFGDALFAHVNRLSAQVTLGYEGARRAFEHDEEVVRRRLTDALLGGSGMDEVATRAWAAGWRIPSTVSVLAVRAARAGVVPDLAGLPAGCLVHEGYGELAIISDSAVVGASIELLESRTDVRTAVSWPVEVADAPNAYRWVTRLLDLADRGVVPAESVLRCRDHQTQLWLHAEPALRQRLVQELLKPLLAETPNSREILSETLLAWLETHDSARAIAARLQVHPQTIRYRWKRLSELFGDQLRNPEFVVPVTMVLKASVPLWASGDRSDFERFRITDMP